jgi:TetR/AcrR family transcriptional regulator, cholesterol catabolism regulator
VGEGTRATSTGSTRDRLLATAARLFRRSGYAGATTRVLANELGIRSPSLYYHIGSKEDLLYELSVASLTHIRAETERAMADEPTALERLRALIRAHVVTALADQDQHAAMLMELRAFGPERRQQVLALRDAYECQVRDAIADAQQEGALRQDFSPKGLGLALLNLLNWTIIWYQPGGDLSPEDVTNLLSTLFLEGALPRQSPPSTSAGTSRHAAGSASNKTRPHRLANAR